MEKKQIITRVTLTISIFIIVALLMILPWVDKNSGSFVILVLTLLINIILLIFIILSSLGKKV